MSYFDGDFSQADSNVVAEDHRFEDLTTQGLVSEALLNPAPYVVKEIAPVTARQSLLERVRNIILSLDAQLFASDVSESVSLIQGLGMDSFKIESLISAIKDTIADVEFTSWYIRASRQGHDTLSSLVDHIAEQQHAMSVN